MNSPARSARFLCVVGAALSLLLGLWIGMARLGFALPLPDSATLSLHGPLMAIGFLQTLIGLERAAAVARAWAYGVPLLSALCVISLILQLPNPMPAIFAAGAALLHMGLCVDLYRRQAEEHFVIMALGAAVLAGGNLLWLAETAIHRIVPWWTGFLILTVAGERYELAHLRNRSAGVRACFRVIVAVLVTALVISPWDFRFGARVAGAALIALALWLARYDLAWQSFKQPGLPRFMAASMIAGYLWLAIGGVFWIWFARFFGAGPLYDAMLHAIFLGFGFSLIFAHAPIVLPSITQLTLPFDRFFYLHAGLLHCSLAIRIAGDLALLPGGQKWGGLLNALAIALFILNTLRAIVSARLG